MYSENSNRSRSHRFSLREPSSFKQLIASGRNRDYVKMNTEMKTRTFLSMTQKVRKSIFDKNAKALNSINDKRRISLESMRSANNFKSMCNLHANLLQVDLQNLSDAPQE